MPTGRVKWWNDEKGYGFIAPDEGDKDLFVHHTFIEGEGFRTLTEGDAVTFEVEPGDKGPSAVQVRSPGLAAPRTSAPSRVPAATHTPEEELDRWTRIAEGEVARGSLDLAQRAIDQALAIDEFSPRALLVAGRIRRQQDRLEEAEALLRRAQDLPPTTLEATEELGLLAAQRGRYREALDLLRRAQAEGGLSRRGREALRSVVEAMGLESRTSEPAPGAPPTPSEEIAVTPPSARVHGDRWTVEDELGYSLYAEAIKEFILHPDTTPPLVISVQGPWGQGKTSLMRMVQSRLDPTHPDFEAAAGVEPGMRPPETSFGDLRRALDEDVTIGASRPRGARTVWFNAWRYQSSEELWAGLAHAILSQLTARLPRVERERFWLKLQLARVDPGAVRNEIYRAAFDRFLPRLMGRVAALLGALLVLGLTLTAAGAATIAGDASGALTTVGVAAASSSAVGAAAGVLIGWARARHEALAKPLEGAYSRLVRQPDYKSKSGYLHLIEEDMGSALRLLAPADAPVVVLIDDLDRCSPDKIGQLLEAVNLFLGGEYPDCVFVLGIDAEVVAASMEVVHADLLAHMGSRRGELGWRFMDKFVQLPFVLPRLSTDQRSTFLNRLIGPPSKGHPNAQVPLADLREEVAELQPDASLKQIGALAAQLDPEGQAEALDIARSAIARGAREFRDSDPKMLAALDAQLAFLSDNPRTIKRAVNLYRFYRFMAWAREASPLGLAAATPDQIARWIVPIVRWPDFVRWVQAQEEEEYEDGRDGIGIEQVLEAARKVGSASAFADDLAGAGLSVGWVRDVELWRYLRSLDSATAFDDASRCGMW